MLRASLRFVIVIAVVGLVGPLPCSAAELPPEVDPPLVAISLRDAIDRALRWHPRDREVVAAVERAQARFEAARAESLPTLNLRYEHVWEDSHVWGPIRVHDPLDLNQVAAISAIPLVHPRAWASWAEERERVELSEAEGVATRREIALAAARAWIGAASLAHALAVEREGLRTAREHERFVRGRLDSGAAAQLDLVRAGKEIAVAAALVDRARAARLRACELLGLLTGAAEALDADVADDHPLSDPDGGADRPVPDIVAAKSALRAATHEAHDMYTDYLPSLHLELIGFYQDHPQPELPVTGIGYAAFLQLKLPLYDGGLREATLHQRRAEKQRSQARLDDITRTIRVERRNGQSDVAKLRASLDQTIEAARLARQALELTESRYANGKGTQLEVIYALRDSRDADIAVAAAEDTWRRAALDFLAARGLLPTLEQLRDHTLR